MSKVVKRDDWLVIFLLTLIFLIFGAVNLRSSLWQGYDNLWLDYLIRQRADVAQPADNIVVIDIDDASLDNMAALAGGWPWPRAVHAELLELIQQQQPKAVVFDLIFADRDIYNPESDLYLNEVMAQFSNVYLPFLHLQTDSDLLFPQLDQYPEQLPLYPLNTPTAAPHASLVLPKAIEPEYWKLGSINFQADEDGIGRRYESIHRVGEWGVATMPAVLAKDLADIEPTAESHWLDWRGSGPEPYPRHGYYPVYMALSQGQVFLSDGYFRDKIVIIGSTAAGLHDIKVTPISTTYPGVFILATAIDNFTRQAFLKPLPSHYTAIVYLIGFTLLCLIMLKLHRIGQILTALLLVGTSLFLMSYQLMLQAAYWLPVLSWLSLFTLMLICFYVYRYLQQQREIRKTVDIFGRFLDPKVVKLLLEQGLTERALKGRSTRVTILFTDIREFTHLSEYRSAVEIVDLLNHYFSRQVEVIFKHSGTLDKFIGDAIMAFWGEPVPQPDQEVAAVNAALDMVDQMVQFRREFGLFDFDIGIGIHTGEVVVGAIGTQSRYDYTAIGDAVNLASRIEGLTKETERRVLVSEETRIACGDAFDFELIGDYKVKGRQELVTVYQPRRLSDER